LTKKEIKQAHLQKNTSKPRPSIMFFAVSQRNAATSVMYD